MSIKEAFEWVVKGEVSEHVWLQAIVGGVIIGFCAALYPAPVLSLIERIYLFDQFDQTPIFGWFIWFASYVLPLVLGLYGVRMLLNALMQCLPEDD